jgi:hypothetical protein
MWLLARIDKLLYSELHPIASYLCIFLRQSVSFMSQSSLGPTNPTKPTRYVVRVLITSEKVKVTPEALI